MLAPSGAPVVNAATGPQLSPHSGQALASRRRLTLFSLSPSDKTGDDWVGQLEHRWHRLNREQHVWKSTGSIDRKQGHVQREGRVDSATAFRDAILAAGRTKVLCACGSTLDAHIFLKILYDQIHISGAAGNATGRNIHQKSLEDAVRMCNAIYEIAVEDGTVEDAPEIYKG